MFRASGIGFLHFLLDVSELGLEACWQESGRMQIPANWIDRNWQELARMERGPCCCGIHMSE
jgi:hypothetical protein